MLTSDQIALVDYIEAKNAKTEAWVAEDPQNRWSTFLVSDAETLAEWGIFSIEDFKRSSAIDTFIDVYKDLNGIKPRWVNFDSMTTEEINKENESMYRQLEESIEEERKWEEARYAEKARQDEIRRQEEKKREEELAESLSVDVETLQRWMKEAA
jgi:hypothetical protein